MVGHHEDVPLGGIVLSSPVDEVGQRVGIGDIGILLSGSTVGFTGLSTLSMLQAVNTVIVISVMVAVVIRIFFIF
jgi:hypothetical protein